MPPAWMWPLSWEVQKHMERVARKRRKKYGLPDEDEDDDDLDDQIESGGERNALMPDWAR